MDISGKHGMKSDEQAKQLQFLPNALISILVRICFQSSSKCYISSLVHPG